MSSPAPTPPVPMMTILGTGTSMGVPMIGCTCEVCTSTDPRNQRMRTGVYIQAPDGNFLIDTPPELRLQLVCERIDMVHAVVYTHAHADHIGAADEVMKALPVGQVLDSGVQSAARDDDNNDTNNRNANRRTSSRRPVTLPTTKAYQDYLAAIAARGAQFTRAEPGQTFQIGR